MTRASRASAPMLALFSPGPDDRVEVGDVELVEPQVGAEPAREGERVAVVAAAMTLRTGR